MLITLFHTIKKAGVPCTLRELLDLLGALEKNFAFADLDDFYFLSRAALVKDEKHYDKFDKAFEIYFKGIENMEDIFKALIPDDWLRKAFEKELDPEELKKIQTLGGLEKLLEEFKKRLEEQQKDTKVETNGLAQMALLLLAIMDNIPKALELAAKAVKRKELRFGNNANTET